MAASTQTGEPPTGGLRGYASVLRVPGAWRFSGAGLVARLPISMIGLGIVLLVTSRNPSYAVAGALASAFALSAALIAPFGARLIDRLGQARVLPVLASLQALGLVAVVLGVERSWPVPAVFGCAVFAGGVGPNIGSLVRARWVFLLRGEHRLRSAFALESVLDEVVFITGPPLATALALSLFPAAPLLLCAVLTAAGSALLAVLRSTDPGPRSIASGESRGHALQLPGMLRVTLVMVLMGGVFGAFEVTTVAYAEAAGRPGATGVLLAIYALGSLIGGLLLGAVRLPGTVTRQLLAATAALALASAPMLLVGGIEWLGLLAFIAGCAVAPVLILSISLTEILVPGSRITEALTLTVSGLAVGLSAAAPLSGYLIDSVSPASGYAVMSLSALGSLLVMATAYRGLQRLEQTRPGT